MKQTTVDWHTMKQDNCRLTYHETDNFTLMHLETGIPWHTMKETTVHWHLETGNRTLTHHQMGSCTLKHHKTGKCHEHTILYKTGSTHIVTLVSLNCHWWELPQVSFLSWQKYACSENYFLSLQNFYRNRYVCLLLLWQKMCFVTTKVLSQEAYFC